MYDLGTQIHLTRTNTDTSGNVTTAGSMSLAIVLPDGTTSSQGTIAVSSNPGVYVYDYTTVQAGRHVAKWTATGTAASVWTDVFDVMPADPRFLFSLDEAKASLRSFSGYTGNDEQIRLYLAAVTPVIEDLAGSLVPQQWIETYDGGGLRIALNRAPVQSVSEVIESYGANYTRTLTAQDIFTGSTDSFGYTIDNRSGVITRRAAGVAIPFAPGVRNVRVTYTAGQTTIPSNVLLAAKEEFRFLWQVGQEGQGLGAGEFNDGMAFTPSGYAVPRRVVELINATRRLPGIA